MVKTKKNDFIELSYIAKVKDTDQIFDLTSEEEAKKEKIYNKDYKYGPKIICIGRLQVIKGLDKELEDKELDKEYITEINSDNAFGQRKPELFKTVTTSSLTSQDINPFPGLQIDASGRLGTVRSVTPGRTTIDFNHPLSGKDVVYKFRITRIITDSLEKLKSLMLNFLFVEEKEYEITQKDKNLEIKLKREIPKEIKTQITKLFKEIIPDLDVTFK